MKSTLLAFAAILSTTISAWSAPAPAALDYDQLAQIAQRADRDPHTFRGFLGAPVKLDLRPAPKSPYFQAHGEQYGLVFICQPGFEEFRGGPILANLARFELGEDGGDFVTLIGCTAQEK